MPPLKRRTPLADATSAPPQVPSGEHRKDLAGDSADIERPLAEVLGIEVRFAPDDLAPPVDTDLLTHYLREELPQDETEQVCRLIGTFRTWYDACSALLQDRLQK